MKSRAEFGQLILRMQTNRHRASTALHFTDPRHDDIKAGLAASDRYAQKGTDAQRSLERLYPTEFGGWLQQQGVIADGLSSQIR